MPAEQRDPQARIVDDSSDWLEQSFDDFMSGLDPMGEPSSS